MKRLIFLVALVANAQLQVGDTRYCWDLQCVVFYPNGQLKALEGKQLEAPLTESGVRALETLHQAVMENNRASSQFIDSNNRDWTLVLETARQGYENEIRVYKRTIAARNKTVTAQTKHIKELEATVSSLKRMKQPMEQ